MSYENAIRQTERFGPHQRRIFPLLCLVAISYSIHKMGGVFLAAKPDFRCLLPHESPENATYRLPPNITNATHTWSYETENWPKCERYDSDLANPYNATGENLKSTPSTAKCDSFVYDKTQYTRTATTEWDLVCENAWLRAMSDSLLMFGDFAGVLIYGAVSDTYGRKPTLILGVAIQFILGLLVAASPVSITFLIFRALVGVTLSGVYLVAYLTAMEMLGPKHRLRAASGLTLSQVIGTILVVGLAYYIRNWRNLQIVFSIPNFVFLMFARYIPESVPWLLTKGRVQEARDIFQKASVANGVGLSQDTLDSLLEDTRKNKPLVEKASIFDILRYPNLRKKTLLLFSVWFMNSFAHYGLSWNTSNLSGNDYLNFLFAAFVEIPAQAFIMFGMNSWGRRNVLCGSLCFSGVSLLVTILVPAHMPWLVTLLAMIGKLTIAITYTANYVFTSEQYPTAIRNVGVGACSAVSRLGGMVAPQLNPLFEISTSLPLAIFGSGALVVSLVPLLLPETLNRKLPETTQEGEDFMRNEKKTEPGIEQLNVDMARISNE